MKVIGNCGTEKQQELLGELAKAYCKGFNVGKVYISFTDQGFCVGKLMYGIHDTVAEVVESCQMNHELIMQGINEMREEGTEVTGYWFLSDDISHCNVTGIRCMDKKWSYEDIGAGTLKILVELEESKVEGFFCYDKEDDILYNHVDYSNMIGEQVAKACGIELQYK